MDKRRVKLLVVDDEPSVRLLLRTTLEEETTGFEIIEASDGAEAISQVTKHQPDLILLDLQMPVLDGVSVIKHLRRNHIYTPVIMLTALSDRESIIRCMEAGATRYVIKPFRTEELLSTLSHAFADAALTNDRARRHEQAFIANVSHEMRTPLQALRSFPLLALKDLDNGDLDGVREKLQQTRDAATRLGGLIDSVLDLSSIESGHVEYRMEQGDLSLLIRDVMDELGQLAKEKRVFLVNHAPNRLCFTMDRGRLRQVLVNLVGNAIKFTPSQGRIDIDAAMNEGNEVHLSVADNGEGIPGNELQFIFEKFRQSSTTAGRIKGTGLGLVICREVVNAHGGRIWAENAESGGAVFHVQLPIQ